MGVTVDYGAARALDGVDLTVDAGEVVAIIGPSGCGKSTLLRAVAGLEPLVSGRVSLDGRDLSSVAPHRRDMGLMFQDHALFPHLDVEGNVAFGLRMRRMERGERRQRVETLLSLVGLDGFAGRPISSLSGGEAQRVALARALAPEPALLMLDEPLGSLDRVLREQLTGDLRRLLGELGQTAIHVTHDQAEAFALADRVAVLRSGRLVQVGGPEELWSSPADAFVAEFVGHANIWRIEVDTEGAFNLAGVASTAEANVSPVRLGVDVTGAAMLGPGPVTVVAPVTALTIGSDASVHPGLAGRVERSEFRGASWAVELETVMGRVEAIAHEPIRPGEQRWIQVALDRLIPI